MTTSDSFNTFEHQQISAQINDIEKELFATENENIPDNFEDPGKTKLSKPTKPIVQVIRKRRNKRKPTYVCLKCIKSYRNYKDYIYHLTSHVALPHIVLRRCDEGKKYIRPFQESSSSYFNSQKKISSCARKKIRPPPSIHRGLKLKLKLDNSGISNSFEVVNEEVLKENLELSKSSSNVEQSSDDEPFSLTELTNILGVDSDNYTIQSFSNNESTNQYNSECKTQDPIEAETQTYKIESKEEPKIENSPEYPCRSPDYCPAPSSPSDLPCHLGEDIMVEVNNVNAGDAASPNTCPSASPAQPSQPSPNIITASPLGESERSNNDAENETSILPNASEQWNQNSPSKSEPNATEANANEEETDETSMLLEQILSGQQTKENHDQIVANEYMSIDRLAQQHTCEVCNVRFADFDTLEEHRSSTGHKKPPVTGGIAVVSSVSLMPPVLPLAQSQPQPTATYGQPPVLPMEQLAQQVRNMPGPTNNMMGIQYPNQQQQQQQQLSQQQHSALVAQHNAAVMYQNARVPPPMYRPNIPPSGYPGMMNYYNQHQGMYPIRPNMSQGMPNLDQQAQPQMSNMGPNGPNSTSPNMMGSPMQMPRYGHPHSMMAPGMNMRPSGPGGARPSGPSVPGYPSMSRPQMMPRGMTPQQMRPNGGVRPQMHQARSSQGPQQAPNGSPNRVRMQKRPNSGPPPNSPNKQKRMDMLLPDRHDNDDCSVIAVQQQTKDGWPVIQNVQGSSQRSGAAGKDSMINLTDQITLSVRNNKDNNMQVPHKKKDANAVANILATRGITVTPAAGRNKDARKSVTPPLTAVEPESIATLNLNGAVSIIPTQRNQVTFSHNKTHTVDLTDDNADLSPSRLRAANNLFACHLCQKQFASQDTLNSHMNRMHSKLSKLPHKCTQCMAQYPTVEGLAAHRKAFHGNTLSELGLPIVDLRQEGTLSRLASLGIQNYIPLSNLNQQTGGFFGLPIVSVQGAQNTAICNLSALGASNILSLGPVKQLPRH